jgi:ribosomal-protein-alanine N-acetyltransferase|tara:strand:- start:3615 stop:4094 length:480 start_codon:yes stop_codon:yes gene_type:complete
LTYSFKKTNSSDFIIQYKEPLEILWSNDSIDKHFDNKKSINIEMSLDSNFIGVLIGHYLYQSSDLDEFEILHIAILPKFRNRGFALNLMKELEKLLNINKKSLKIFLEVSSFNKFAIKLYEKLGYKAYNERKNYYRSKSINAPNTQDAILFAKSLNAIK